MYLIHIAVVVCSRLCLIMMAHSFIAGQQQLVFVMVYYTQAMVEHSILTMVGRKGTTLAAIESTSVGVVIVYEIQAIVSSFLLILPPSAFRLKPSALSFAPSLNARVLLLQKHSFLIIRYTHLQPQHV